MSFSLSSFSTAAMAAKAAQELEQLNQITSRFGLTLSAADAAALVEARNDALRKNGRIEFGGGAMVKIAKTFCDSPYLSMENYATTLHELTEIFYYYKNETMERMGDDTLISIMKESFDQDCHGSTELLAGLGLDQLARDLRRRDCKAPTQEDENDHD